MADDKKGIACGDSWISPQKECKRPRLEDFEDVDNTIENDDGDVPQEEIEKYPKIAYDNYQKQVEENKSKLDGYLGYTQIENEIDLIEQEWEKETSDAEEIPDDDPTWEKYQQLEQLKSISEDLPMMGLEDYKSVEELVNSDESDWSIWLEGEDLKKANELLDEGYYDS